MKKLLMLGVVLLILIAGYLLVRVPAVNEEIFTGFSTERWGDESIDQIILGDLTLQKQEGKWLVNDFPADQTRLTNLLDALKIAQVIEEVSTNQENHQRFQVDGTGTNLKQQIGNDVIAETIVGKTAGVNSVYMRLPDNDSVYEVFGLASYLFTPELDSWRDRKVTTFTGEEVRLVSFQQGFINWEVAQQEDVWQLKRQRWADVVVDTEKVTTWLNGLGALSASAFPDEESQQKSLATVTIELGTVDEFSSKVEWSVHTTPDENQLLITRNEDQLGFLVAKSIFENTFLNYADLLEKMQVGDE